MCNTSPKLGIKIREKRQKGLTGLHYRGNYAKIKVEHNIKLNLILRRKARNLKRLFHVSCLMSHKIMAKKANSAFMKPLKVSAELEAVVGKGPMPRSEVVKKLWAYIKKNGLQDQKNKRNINADDKLKAVFGGKGVVNMFEMTKLVSKHLS